MILTPEKVQEIIEKGTDPKIYEARRRAKKLNMHVTGHKVIEFLERIDTYENEAQLILREKLVKSNKSTFNWLLKPMDKIFTAKGGSVNYNLSKEEIESVRDKLNEASDHLDLKRYLRKVVKIPYVIDPSGLLFVELDEKGNPFPTIKKTENILWYENKGNRIEAVIFEGYYLDDIITENAALNAQVEFQETQSRPKYYRVYDEVKDTVYKWDGTNLEEIEDEIYKNYFGYVPGWIMGDNLDPNIGIYDSIIDEVVEDADQFLRRASTMNVHELAHLYSRYWSYAQACTRCEGEGVLRDSTDPENIVENTCSSCGGTGIKTRTNPSDETIIPVPMEGEPVITPNVAGYVSPDIQIAQFYHALQEGQRTEMFQSLWGTTYQTDKNRETALARFIDAKPVEDKLRDVSATFEKMHEFLLNSFVRIIMRKSDYRSSVSYGNRYILESADAILKEYKEASRESISEVVIEDLKHRYVEAEYQTDSVELSKRKKLMRLEPFPTLSITQVMALPVSDLEKQKKLYFSQWVNSLKPSMVILRSEKVLLSNLEEYVTKFNLIPQNNEESE